MRIDYKKKWNNETGTCYRQTITIDKWIMEEFNKMLMNKKINIDNVFLKKHTYSEQDLKIKSLDYLKIGVNYTNLIHLRLFIELIFDLNNKGYNFNYKRILNRNTLIKVI